MRNCIGFMASLLLAVVAVAAFLSVRVAGQAPTIAGQWDAGAGQANRGWAKEEAFRLYSEALELVPADDVVRRREIGKQLAVVAQAVYHVIDAERLVRHSQPEEG